MCSETQSFLWIGLLSFNLSSSKEWHEDLSVSHSAEQHTFTQPTEMHDDSEQVYIVHMKIMLFFLKEDSTGRAQRPAQHKFGTVCLN